MKVEFNKGEFLYVRIEPFRHSKNQARLVG